jgi:hypothetical protein
VIHELLISWRRDSDKEELSASELADVRTGKGDETGPKQMTQESGDRDMVTPPFLNFLTKLIRVSLLITNKCRNVTFTCLVFTSSAQLLFSCKFQLQDFEFFKVEIRGFSLFSRQKAKKVVQSADFLIIFVPTRIPISKSS